MDVTPMTGYRAEPPPSSKDEIRPTIDLKQTLFMIKDKRTTPSRLRRSERRLRPTHLCQRPLARLLPEMRQKMGGPRPSAHNPVFRARSSCLCLLCHRWLGTATVTCKYISDMARHDFQPLLASTTVWPEPDFLKDFPQEYHFNRNTISTFS